MDSARQIVRWSIPGALFFGALMFFLFLHGRALDSPQLHADAATIATIIAASVPMGFLIYQIYFVFYDRGLPWLNVVALDRGGAVIEILSKGAREHLWASIPPIPEGGADTLPTTHTATERRPMHWGPHRLPRGAIQKDREAYRERRERNMAIIRAWLDTFPVESVGRVKREYTVLSDIYHSQGAARFAVLMAAPTSVWYSLMLNRGSSCARLLLWRSQLPADCADLWVMSAFTLAIAVGLAALLNMARRSTWVTARDTLAQSMEAILGRPSTGT